jgi:MoxR-like ATPase
MNAEDWGKSIKANIAQVFIGKETHIDLILATILAGGHILLDDVPGVGKTRLARAFAQSFGITVSRIQCTPDLLPSDITGVSIYNPQDGNFRFRKGPVLNHFILVDEINRASPRTQSALLEAMGESQVTIEGKSIPLPQPFFVIATQNPVDSEGTYPLPEAQKDRFMLTLSLGYLSNEQELDLFNMKDQAHDVLSDLKAVASWDNIPTMQSTLHEIHVAESLRNYILALCQATRTSPYLRMGVSPRGSLSLFRCSQALATLRGRTFVKPEDIQDLVIPVFISRIIPRQQSIVKGMEPHQILQSIMESIPVPVLSTMG